MKRLNLRGVEKGPNEKSIEDILRDAGCRIGRVGLLGLPGRPAGHVRPAEQGRKSASARPTAISPAAWARWRRRCSWPAR